MDRIRKALRGVGYTDGEIDVLLAQADQPRDDSWRMYGAKSR